MRGLVIALIGAGVGLVMTAAPATAGAGMGGMGAPGQPSVNLPFGLRLEDHFEALPDLKRVGPMGPENPDFPGYHAPPQRPKGEGPLNLPPVPGRMPCRPSLSA